MRILVTLAPDDLGRFRERVQHCEEAGVDGVGVGDSPGFADVYVALTVAAAATSRLSLGPMVTNLVTRTPQVTVRALTTLAELAPGRLFTGIGAGDSALAPSGARPRRTNDFRSTLREMRTALGGVLGPIGVVVAANGPRMLAAGGAVADTVVSGSGIDPDALARAAAAVRSGADGADPAAAGERPPAAPAFWTVVRMSGATATDDALHELRPLLSSGANHVFGAAAERAALPSEIGRRVDALRSGYDYASHGRRAENPNAELVDRLELRSFLAGRFALVGSTDRVVGGLVALAAAGVSGVVIPAVGLDADRLIDRLGSDLVPALRRESAAAVRR